MFASPSALISAVYSWTTVNSTFQGWISFECFSLPCNHFNFLLSQCFSHFSRKLRFSCLICLFLSSQRRRRLAHLCLFLHHRLKGWQWSWVKAGKLKFLGYRKLEDRLANCVTSFFSHAPVDINLFSFSAVLMTFWWFFFLLLFFFLKQHVACFKTTATFHSHVQIYAVCMRIWHPHFPFLLFGYGRSYLSTVRADSLNN